MCPRTKEQNSQIKDERREQILLVALKLFAKRGLAATKISDIAKNANLSHGLIYHYFQSKEDIFIELVSRALEESAKELREADGLPLESLDKIETIAENVIKGIDETEDSAFYFLLMIQAYVSDANPKEVKELMQNSSITNEIILKIVEEGQKSGSIGDGNPQDYVMIFWALIQGLAFYKLLAGEGFKAPSTKLLLKMFQK
jgi:AcrR family transcriptional regulator